jgi:hypothetical protein
MTAMSLDQLAQYRCDDGHDDEALSMLQQSLRIRSGLGDRPMVAENLARVAHVLARTGRAAAAARLLSSSEGLREQIGSNSTPPVAKRNKETLMAIRSKLGDEPLAEAWNQGRALTTDEAVALALAAPAPNGAA